MTRDTGDAGLKHEAMGLVQCVFGLRAALVRQVIGQDALVDDVLCALLAGGHILLEGLPGLGKTLLARALGHGLGLSQARIQFTPDLMPADVTGTTVVDEAGGRRVFRFQKGPVFAGLVLADEINRATPKTQSALLEAMQEGAVTVAGETHRLPHPFHVIATQNPIELEGTFPLPEAQLDRFLFKLEVRPPSIDSMVRILAETTGLFTSAPDPTMATAELAQVQAFVRQVLIGEHLVRFVASLVAHTHPDMADATENTKRYVRYGASARAGQAIILGAKARALLAGRSAVIRDDLEACALPALRHRVLLGFEAEVAAVQIATLLPEWRAQAERELRANR